MLSLLPLRASTSLRTSFVRSLSTTPSLFADTPSPSTGNGGGIKVPITLIASLRKIHPVPLAQAREALERSNLDLKSAIDYLQSASSSNAEKKAAKVSGRSTNEGVIAISLLGGKRVGMVQLGCETDFVARNQVFLKTARGVAETTAFLDVPGSEEDDSHHKISATASAANNAQEQAQDTKTQTAIHDPILEFPTESLLSAPLIFLPQQSSSDSPTPIPTSDPQTIRQTLLSSLSQTGENLKLLRAVSFAAPFPSSPTVRFVPGAYAHGGPSDKEGKVGGIVVLSVTSLDAEKPIASMIHGPGGDVLEKDLGDFARTVARQVVGFPTKAVEKGEGTAVEDEEALYEQPFMMFNGDDRKVKDVLDAWGKEKGVVVKVVGIRRWAVGDDLGSAEAEKEATA
ncbi:hypothetical protein CI109_102246 [Kwoniella shandongensis]|uniref:Uncharacterized protein n=1 Tax=Kwoniella shandongensis TaxID=1734106 RepID=A0A5M6BYN2_9TREE|nr:uncharacterized protein CI109_003600 [Kwoniella shandongensis]KAA5527946.1 hypothetical protein CI109_003600 [Kwoniella shandongensis]